MCKLQKDAYDKKDDKKVMNEVTADDLNEDGDLNLVLCHIIFVLPFFFIFHSKNMTCYNIDFLYVVIFFFLQKMFSGLGVGLLREWAGDGKRGNDNL